MFRLASDAEHAAQIENPVEALRRLLAYFRPYRFQVGLVVGLVIVYALLNAVGPYLLGLAIDDFIEQGDRAGLLQITVTLVVMYLLMWGTQVVYSRMMAAVAQKMMDTLRRALFGHIQKLSMSFFNKQSAGDLMSSLTNDMDNINILLSQNLVTFITSLVTLVSVLAAMFLLNVWLALATVVVFPIMLVVTGGIMNRIGPAFREQQASLGRLNGLMEERLSGQRVIIAYGQQNATLQEFERANTEARDIGIRAQILAGIIIPLTMGLGNLDLAIVVGVGGAMAIAGVAGVTVGMITTYTGYARSISLPVTQISNLFSSIIAALAGAQRIFKVLDIEPEVQDKVGAVQLGAIQGRITFTDVDFSYSPGQPILRGINLRAEPGEMIALIGPTGAGKTTIVNVLARFYDIEHGAICIDDYEIHDVQQDNLRQCLGVVLQDTYLFSATVMDNIRYGRLEATDEEVYTAAKLANAHGFITRLPQGYHTMLSERASNISQGQRQLLAIARAILANPTILILDEATSSVDTRTEKQIQNGLRNLMQGRTSFVIAHRLSTVREADQILAIRNGRIVERGTHKSLLDKKGYYYQLYTSQFKGTLKTEDIAWAFDN